MSRILFFSRIYDFSLLMLTNFPISDICFILNNFSPLFYLKLIGQLHSSLQALVFSFLPLTSQRHWLTACPLLQVSRDPKTMWFSLPYFIYNLMLYFKSLFWQKKKFYTLKNTYNVKVLFHPQRETFVKIWYTVLPYFFLCIN